MANKQLIVIGGGAAGFFAAINAAQQNANLSITILEKTSKLLSKVKISGGGRCNVTHHCFDNVELSKKYPRGASFLKKAFHQFNAESTVAWFAKHNVILKVEADGRMFPSTNSSQTIIDCFLKLAEQYNIKIVLSAAVQQINQINNQFHLFVNDATYTADYICVATGGFPKLTQYDWVNAVNEQTLKIVTPIPSLFTFNIPNNNITSLMGIAEKNVAIKIKGTKLSEQGIVLITHWGLSGPAILKLSAFAAIEINALDYHFTIQVNWLPQYNETSFLHEWKNLVKTTKQQTGNFNPFNLSMRLWHYFLTTVNIDLNTTWHKVNAEKTNAFVKLVTNMELKVAGKTTYKDEFVTAGGVDLSQIDHNTMQHKQVKNLFFAGEILNIDGVTGGFNFQNAWTTAYIAAQSISKQINTN